MLRNKNNQINGKPMTEVHGEFAEIKDYCPFYDDLDENLGTSTSDHFNAEEDQKKNRVLSWVQCIVNTKRTICENIVVVFWCQNILA